MASSFRPCSDPFRLLVGYAPDSEKFSSVHICVIVEYCVLIDYLREVLKRGLRQNGDNLKDLKTFRVASYL